MWTVVYLPAAEAERAKLAARERAALRAAVEKLAVYGPALPFPHSSVVQGPAGTGLWELRPRAGRSPTRALYARVGDVFVIAAVGPEAHVDRRGFDRAVRAAHDRLAELEP